MHDCPFCKDLKEEERENLFCALPTVTVIKSLHPVCDGHYLIIPKRHIEKMHEAHAEELLDIHGAIRALSHLHFDYNIGVNCGEEAGQSVPHLHVHFFARRPNDGGVKRGGVRHIFPEKGNY